MKYPLSEILSNLPENKVANILLRNWDSIAASHKSKEEMTDALSPLLLTPAVPGVDIRQTERIDKWKDVDLRFLNLRVSGVKGIPYDKVYGIDFRGNNANDCYSWVLLGWNGSGKSSIYNAIELLFKDISSVELKHRIKNDNRHSFYHHFGEEKPITIELRTVENTHYIYKEHALDKINLHLDLAPFFCSESDIALFECNGCGMAEYLDDLLGLTEIVLLKEILTDINQRLSDEAGRIDRNDEEQLRKKEILDKIIEEIMEINSRSESERADIKNEILPTAQDILERLVSPYLDDKVELHYNDADRPIFTGDLIKKGTPITINPRHYFNNFRLKLYIVSLRIAIAFNLMRRLNINFPLIFDDVFDSSDFQNRTRIAKFFENIHKSYEELKIHSQPLQMIFFTQDEVIGKSVYEGIRKVGHKNIKIARLFNPEEAEEKDKVIISIFSGINKTNSGCEYSVIPTLPYSFYNLYDKIK